MRSAFLALLALALAGCSGTVIQASNYNPYIGRSVAELADRVGPPSSASLQESGEKIYEWTRFGPPQQKIGKITTAEGVVLAQGRCKLVVAAEPRAGRRSPSMADWTIVEMRYVGGGCV